MGEGGSAKTLHWSISLFSKMGDKGEGEFKNVKKTAQVISFMDGPRLYCRIFVHSSLSILQKIHSKIVDIKPLSTLVKNNI